MTAPKTLTITVPVTEEPDCPFYEGAWFNRRVAVGVSRGGKALLASHADIGAAMLRATEPHHDFGPGAYTLPRLTMILAVARNGVIGHKGKIPWRISEDMRHFRGVTMGHTLIVGRKTWETLPPLDGRRLVVVSRDEHRGALSLWDALVAARETDPEPIVIGGAEVYRDALPFVTRIHLTEIGADYEGDTVFHLDRTGFVETSRRAGETPGVSFVTLERR